MSSIVLTIPTSSVTIDQGRAVTTATVTNGGATTENVVLAAFRPLAVASGEVPSAAGWTSVDRPQREIQPGGTEQFTITFAPPAGTAAGAFTVRFIAYPAYGAPEEGADQASRVVVTVPAGVPVAPPPRTPWWIYLVAAGLALVVGTVAFFVLRPAPCTDGSCAPPSASPTPTPTPVVIEGITWTLTGIREGDAVTAVTALITLRVEGDQVSGKAGCNSYRGMWTQADSQVEVGAIQTTLALCFPQEVAAQTSKFLGTLRVATTLRVEGDTLELGTGDDRALRFTRS